MATVLPTLLRPNPLNKVVKRVKVLNTGLQQLFGCGLGGDLAEGAGDGGDPGRSRVQQISGRFFAYDIFDDVRQVATARAPGAPLGKVAPQVVGNVSGAFPRTAESVPLLDEKIHNLRPIGGPVGELDRMGEKYIMKQIVAQKQRVVNMREFQLAAMLRGSYTWTRSGDDLYHGFSGGAVTVNFQIPAGNLSQLNMLGGGDIIGTAWDDAAAPILTDLQEINAAMIQLSGRPLKNIIVNDVVLGYVLGNTQVQSRAGTSHTPFMENQYKVDPVTGNAMVVLAGAPQYTWHVINEALGVGSANTTTKLIADTQATFLPEITDDWFEYWEGSEIVTEKFTGTRQERFGAYAWANPQDNPSGYELNIVHNGIPALQVPKCIATGTVDF